MQNYSLEIKVGIFVLISLIALAYMTTRVSKGKFVSSDMYTIEVYFDNVTGLKKNAPVEIAGIEVGLVKDIVLDNNRAKVILALRPDVKVYADAEAFIKTRGVLGDKFIELRSGSPTYPSLNRGGVIARSNSGADLGELMQKVGQIADDIGRVARSVSNVLGGPEGERDLKLLIVNLREMAVSLNKMVKTNMENINAIVKNFREFSRDLKELSGNNKSQLDKIVDNFDVATRELKEAMAKMNVLLAKANTGEGVVAKLLTDKEMGDDLKQTLASLKTVAKNIEEGKGTLGKLINEDTTAKNLDKTLEGLNKYLSKQDKFKTSIDVHSEYLTRSRDIKSYVSLKLQPSPDKYYLLSIVDDPKGRTEETSTYRKYRTDGGTWHTYEEHKTETEEDGLKFSLQIAKRFHDLVLRGGIIESTGGLGLDYYLWDDRVKLFFEAFDFDDKDPAHLKAGANLYLLRNFYLTAGMDDFAKSDDRSFFAGAGLYFTDEDLKYIMGSAPLPKK
ncbi:phospholipid/cholesterol/gamma-HCH transport system substrate-binding protein [Desulfonauticus submarinus]|uniref:Phospholipid/cholesterol/gamma-HCH transport system substrate-binding protein n=1 Tax=Desulfonauticus submarinus TaxID=206665 RepID=A0A1H0BX62_9BACT|nr:MlaD family protein [Desulfonauticus submarinus]SDN50070.1 phospholipid/cholesterol/gamma-HCH transport system substrate-binding protein [Desulfonauticus submarinus]